MLPTVVDVTALTGHKVSGRVTAWQTRNGLATTEHLAGQGQQNECLVFSRSGAVWQVTDVTAITGGSVAGPLTSWQTLEPSGVVEHLAGRSIEGHLLAFRRSPQQDWQAVDVSSLTGSQVVVGLTSWQTPDGAGGVVEHLAGCSPQGDLLVFYRSSQHDWQVVDVSAITGRRVVTDLTSWQTPNGPTLVHHLAGRAADGSLLVFWWSAAHDWQVVDVSAITGRRVAGVPTSWVTPDGPQLVEHLGVRGEDGSFLVFYWTPATDWRVVDASRITAQPIAGTVSVTQLASGQANAEVVAARSRDGALVVQWWTPSRDWQSVNWSEAVGPGHLIAGDPTSWLTRSVHLHQPHPLGPAGLPGLPGHGHLDPFDVETLEEVAATTQDGTLLVFSADGEPRQLVDAVTAPFGALPRTRDVRRRLLTVLWDPHRATDPAPAKAAVEQALFGADHSVRDYYLQNSDGWYTIENAGVLGWFDADKPAEHYWGPPDTGDSDGDGWIHGHVEKWAEGIRKADGEFDFKPFDDDPLDGALQPAELGILFVTPQRSPFGTNRGTLGREYPQPEPLVVDGVRIGTVAEVYLGDPVDVGVCAHELCHLFLNGPDMYFSGLRNPYAAGDYSLMDGTYDGTHLDPFLKLKYGWLRPKVIMHSGTYTLPDVETRHAVWILMDPRRTTKEYFIVENRWPGTSYDTAIPQPTGGLGVWQIMEDTATYGTVAPPPGVTAAQWATVAADDWGRRGVRMIRPVFVGGIDDHQALWDAGRPGLGYDLVSDDPDPSHNTLRWADGTPSGFALRGIPVASAEATVQIEVPF